MYLCCRSISVKRVQWHHVRLVADADSPTGYNLTLDVAEKKTDMEYKNKHSVIMYANYNQAVFCPVLAFCVLIYVFGAQIKAACTDAGSWPQGGVAAARADELDVAAARADELEFEGDEAAPDDGAAAPAQKKAFVFPHLSRGYAPTFAKQMDDGCTTFWSLFVIAAGLVGMHLTGHSFRHMAHTFAFYVGVTSDMLRQFATWENRNVEAGAAAPRTARAHARARLDYPHAPPFPSAYDHPTQDQIDVIARKKSGLQPRVPRVPRMRVLYAYTATQPFVIPLNEGFERFEQYALKHMAMAFGAAPPVGAAVTLADKLAFVALSMSKLIAARGKPPSVFGGLHVAAAAAATAAAAAAAGIGGAAPAVGAAAGVGIGAVVGFGTTLVCEFFALRITASVVYASVGVGGVTALAMQRALLFEQLVACQLGVVVAVALPFLFAFLRAVFFGALTPPPRAACAPSRALQCPARSARPPISWKRSLGSSELLLLTPNPTPAPLAAAKAATAARALQARATTSA
jgi:hypothetical protein